MNKKKTYIKSKNIFKWALSIIIVLGSLSIITYFLLNPSKITYDDYQITEETLKVRAKTLNAIDYPISIESYGQVSPSSLVELKSQTAGNIYYLSEKYYPGSFVKSEEILIQVNSEEYIRNAQLAKLTLNKAVLALEKQKNALEQKIEEFNILKNNPKFNHLFKQKDTDAEKLVSEDIENKSRTIDIESEYQSAKIKYEKSLFAINNTNIVAPFDGRILSIEANTTQYITEGQKLATLYPTDAFTVRLPIKLFDQQYIQLPNSNPLENNTEEQKSDLVKVIITNILSPKHDLWPAILDRTEAKLDDKNHLLHVIATIPKPYDDYNKNKKPLIIGQYVKANIEGITLKNRLMLSRRFIQQDQYVYIVKDNTLYKKHVTIGWRDKNNVEILSGLSEGDLVVITALTGVYSGTPVEIIQ